MAKSKKPKGPMDKAPVDKAPMDKAMKPAFAKPGMMPKPKKKGRGRKAPDDMATLKSKML